MTDRRPLGTGPVPTSAEADAKLPRVPRAQLAAERLHAAPAAAEPKPTPAVGRRALGAGPATPGR
ncbi:hypothetical protein KBZ94_41475 [Streptomyces sp. RM72]|uniref:hypothetical protein n=1 Tax=Streptomyces sp. RM72 TaxID=1115510 RepID=UPI001B391249|nr:hypothetical protein [Streptomyces sp. RM72]MBQ0891304.1 hypothetical protein [Streptomyces sp. RM72]